MPAPPPRRPRVVFVTAVLTQYRAPLHEAIRALLAAEGVDYTVLYSDPEGAAALKGDAVDLPWATKVPALHLGGFGRTGVWQRIGRHIHGADLLILQEGNKILHNIPLLAARLLGNSPKLAFFGHGRNFQETRRTVGESIKRWVNLQVDWWFAYTDRSADALTVSGFPKSCITVMNNSIDTSGLRADLSTVTPTEIATLRAELNIADGAAVGLFVGALYSEKRIGFLLDAAGLIHAERPDFVLLVAGDGPDRKLLDGAHPYLRVLGSRFGKDKAVLLRTADLLLMPGAIGLVVLDAFCAGLPLVTTSITYHGPEFAYLTDDVAGVVVADPTSARAYADAVLALMGDNTTREQMSKAASLAAGQFSIEAMAGRVAEGAIRLISPPHTIEPRR